MPTRNGLRSEQVYHVQKNLLREGSARDAGDVRYEAEDVVLFRDYEELLLASTDQTIVFGLAVKYLCEAGGDWHSRFLAEPKVQELLAKAGAESV